MLNRIRTQTQVQIKLAPAYLRWAGKINSNIETRRDVVRQLRIVREFPCISRTNTSKLAFDNDVRVSGRTVCRNYSVIVERRGPGAAPRAQPAGWNRARIQFGGGEAIRSVRVPRRIRLCDERQACHLCGHRAEREARFVQH